MIATIKAPSNTAMKRGLFQAMMMGVECESYADDTFSITVHDQSRADTIANAASGKIIAVVDHMPTYPY